MNIIKKLFWLALLAPATAQAQYYGVTPSTATGRATMRLSGQELIYASSSATSPSIILQGNGGRITATGGITVSSATVNGNATITGTLTSPYINIGTSGHSYDTVDANIYGALGFYGNSAVRMGVGYSALRLNGPGGGFIDLGYGMNHGINKHYPSYPLDVGGTISSDYGIRATTAAISGNATIGGVLSVSSATMSGNVAIGTTTAQTRLNVYGGDIRVQGDSTGFGTVPTSGEGLEIAYDSVNHYAWFGAYNRTAAAYTGNYMDGSTLGLNYYSKGPVAIGGNTSAPGLALTYGISAATATFTGTAKITGTLQIPTGASSGYLLVSDANGNASWTAPATGGVVLTATQTFSGANIFTSSTVLNGGMFRGSNLLDVPAIVSSGTFRMGSMYITTPMNDNQTYDLVMIASCTAATPIYARINYASSAVYEWLRTYKTSSGTNSYAVTTISGLLLGNANSAGDEVIINVKFAVHTSGWTHGLSYAATSISSYASSGSVNEEIGGGWTITGTQVNNLTINTDGGICSGKYKLTTTGW